MNGEDTSANRESVEDVSDTELQDAFEETLEEDTHPSGSPPRFAHSSRPAFDASETVSDESDRRESGHSGDESTDLDNDLTPLHMRRSTSSLDGSVEHAPAAANSSAPPPLPSRASRASHSSAPPPIPPGDSKRPRFSHPAPFPLGVSAPPPRPSYGSAPPPIPLVAKRGVQPSSHPPNDATRQQQESFAHALESHIAEGAHGERLARLLVELARVTALHLRDLSTAAVHYTRAMRAAPEMLSAVQGARVTLVALGRIEEALPLFDAEAKLLSSPRQKSLLLYEKGRLLEIELGDRANALSCFRAAHELDRQNALVITNLARMAEAMDEIDAHRELDKRFEQLANLAKSDAESRSSYTIQRAFLAEAEGDRERAITLFESALQDEETEVALEGLDRLYSLSGRDRERANILVRRANRTQLSQSRAYLLLESGRLLEGLGNEIDAHQAYVQSLKADPELPPALEAVARTSSQTGDWKRAANVLASIGSHLGFTPAERANALARLARVYDRHLDQREQAITAFRQALKLQVTSESLEALRQLLEQEQRWTDVAELLLFEIEHTSDRNIQSHLTSRAADVFEVRLTDLDRAIELYQRALNLAPGSVDAFRALRRLLADRHRWRELVQVHEAHLDHAQSAAEQAAMLLDIAGLYELHLQDIPMAVHTYERLLEVAPTHLSAILGLQRTAKKDGQYETLLRAIEKEAEQLSNPAKLTQVLHRGAQVAERFLDDRRTALLWLKRALAVDAAHLPTLHAIARLAQEMGRWEDLIEALEAIANTSDGEVRAHYYTLISETAGEQLGSKEKALEFAQYALEASPSSREAFKRLAQVLEEQERWTELVAAIEKRISAVPEEHDIGALALRAGRIYLEQLSNVDKAEVAFNFARSKAPHELSTWRTLEQLYEKREAWDKVEALLHDAVIDDAAQLEPKHRAALAARGSQLSLEHLHDSKRAARYLEVGLSLDPGNTLLMRLRARLDTRTHSQKGTLAAHTALAEKVRHPGLLTAHLHEAAELCTGHAARITVAEQILKVDPSDTLAAQQLRVSAAETGDKHRLGNASAVLATLAEDEFSRSLHLSTAGEVHEQLGAMDQALDAYRMALTEDAENLSAVRGLSRVARLRDDPNLLAEAARCAARAADDPSAAASLLTRSAQVRVHRLGDELGARRDLERALELAPGHEHATSALVELLSEPEQRKDLIQLLSRSANSAKQPKQQRALWLRVADLQEASHNRTGAISALSRVLRIKHEDTAALLRLAALYAADQQWTESVNLLNQVIRSNPERDALQKAHIELARIWHTHLGDSDRARVSLQAVLALDPYNMEALSSLVRVHCDEGNSDEARNLAQRLVQRADTPQSQANGHLLLSEVEHMAGRPKQALAHALHAYEEVGPSPHSLETVEALAQSEEDWTAYGKAISTFVERRAHAGPPPEDAVVHLADMWWEKLSNRQQALDVYKHSLPMADTSKVRMAYARRLVEAGSPEKATRVLRKLLARELNNPEAWRLLGAIRRRQEGIFAERVCLEVVRGIGEDTAADAQLIANAPPRQIPDVVAHEQAWLMHFPDSGYAHTLRQLLVAIGPALPKLFETRFEEYNLDPVADPRAQPAVAMCNSLCVLLDIEAIQLRFHDIRSQGPTFGFGDPATLFLPQRAREWQSTELCFHLSRWLVAHRLGLSPVLRLSAHEIQTTLVSALRIHDKGYGSGTNSEELLAKQSKLTARAVGRKGRKRIVELAEQLRSERRIVYEDWCHQMTHACERIAAVLCDELAVALASVASDRDDLLRFWTSDSAQGLRQAVGLPQ